MVDISLFSLQMVRVWTSPNNENKFMLHISPTMGIVLVAPWRHPELPEWCMNILIGAVVQEDYVDHPGGTNGIIHVHQDWGVPW